MAPSKTGPAASNWNDTTGSDSDATTPPSSPPVIAARPRKFEDEEDSDDVLDDWENDEDSEVEREKAKKAAEVKAVADAKIKAEHKSKSQRIEEKRLETMKRKQEMELEGSSDEEDEATKRARARDSEKAADLANAEDLFGGVGGVPATRGEKKITVATSETDPTATVDLSSLKLFAPSTASGFTNLRNTLTPLLVSNSKKPQYPLFMAEFAKQLCGDMGSEQVKKIASALTAMSNEKMKEEKAAERGGKKTKAQKVKVSLSAGRDVSRRADTEAYDDGGLDE